MNENTLLIPIVASSPIDFRPLAIYVHGLASGAAGTTISLLTRKFKQYRWITTDFGENIAENVLMLEYLIERYMPSLVLGTSMGGLAVLYANAPAVIKIVCNPALSIANSVRHTIGLGQHNYFCNRINGKQTFELTEEMCLEYEDYIANHPILLSSENYAIFSAHDELLGEEASSIARQVVSEAGYNVLIDSKGVHRITSSTLKLVGEIVNRE